VNKGRRVYAVICVVIVIFGLILVTLPLERLLYHEEYTSLEFYPQYYYTNFTVASSDPNAELSFNLDLDFGGNYTDGINTWILYQLLPEQFEESFNITDVHDIMLGNWDIDDFGAFWAGWFSVGSIHPFWSPIPAGAYVFVFWIEPDGPTTGWSATLSLSLRTRILLLM